MECIVVNPVQGVQLLSHEGIEGLVRKKGAKTTCYTRVSPWEPNPRQIGLKAGLLEEKRGFGWCEPSSKEEVLSRASYEASGMASCVAFAVHPRLGVQFYDEEAFGPDGSLEADPDWTTYTPRDPWHPLPETIPAQAPDHTLVEVGLLAAFDTPGWLSPPNGENYVEPEEVLKKACRAAAATSGCVGMAIHPTKGLNSTVAPPPNTQRRY